MGPYFNRLKEFWLSSTQVVSIDDFGYTALFPDPNVFSAIFLSMKSGAGSTQETILREVTVQDGHISSLDESRKLLTNLSLETWKPYKPVVQKTLDAGQPLRNLCFVKDVGFNYWTQGREKTRGDSIGSRVLYDGVQRNANDIAFLKGGDFTRYDVPTSRDHWLKHDYETFLDPQIDIFRFSPQFLQVPMKIVYRQTADSIIATLDLEGCLVDKTVHVILLREDVVDYSYIYLLAILNSKLINHVYTNLAREEGRVFSQVKTFRTQQLPIRRINFTLSPEQRAYYLDKARNLYAYCLDKHDQDCVLGFVNHHLAREPEESDVVHDLLAMLVEEMMRLNKEKRAAQREFLDWLVSTLKILPDRDSRKGIDALTGKSKLLDYPGDYQKGEPPTDLLEILQKNRAHLGVSLSDTILVDRLRKVYEESLQRVLPLKEQMAKTDRLIDAVVYRLYGLTEEEIKIVEGKEGDS